MIGEQKERKSRSPPKSLCFGILSCTTTANHCRADDSIYCPFDKYVYESIVLITRFYNMLGSDCLTLHLVSANM